MTIGIEKPKLLFHCGLVGGLRTSSIEVRNFRLSLEINTSLSSVWPELEVLFDKTKYNQLRKLFSSAGNADLLEIAVFELYVALFESFLVPLYELPRKEIDREQNSGDIYLFPTTALAVKASIAFIKWLQVLITDTASSNSSLQSKKTFPELVALLRQAGLGDTTAYHLMRTAHELGLPATQVIKTTQAYGQGRRNFWTNSSFTAGVSVSSANMCRNKSSAHAVLCANGIPVPRQIAVASLEQAKIAAKKMGYPVVLKPASLDGGHGVTPDIRRERGLEIAYQKAERYKTPLLLESHEAGKDYRLVVMRGVMLGAIERVPGGVVGDGVSSVKQLLAALNKATQESGAARKGSSEMKYDEEMALVLVKQGMTIDSVPAKDAVVRLRHTANLNSGGRPIDITERVHPDNADLAIRAAAAMRLELAGVDLLMPDISQSWVEVGGVICEVNGQPAINTLAFSRLYPKILRELTPGNGRIPVMLSLGVDASFAGTLAEKLSRNRLIVGVINQQGLFKQGRPLQAVYPSQRNWLYQRTQHLLSDPEVDVLLVQLEEPADLSAGSPCDRVDLIVRPSSAGKSLELAWDELLVRIEPYLADGEKTMQLPSNKISRIVKTIIARAEACAKSPL